MTQEHDHKDTGLRGIEVADTNICLIEGKTGNLFYRGYNIRDLGSHSSFEEVVYLLLYGDLPSRSQLDVFTRDMVRNRSLPQGLQEMLIHTPHSTPSMNVLQSALAYLAGFDPETENDTKEANIRKAIRLIPKV